ncbi:nuclear transport factor 2 family protein [Brevundimonas naejangsanensis]|uniref:Nuclear transport factor 2 family protein n=2 Tax=Brevundimonas naejangsanensis TaxID=588932 RepID=A0A494RFC9_9CAUL|nr:nuclear transport factor 2 family protein [Brevundimonas naejangsanensis]
MEPLMNLDRRLTLALAGAALLPATRVAARGPDDRWAEGVFQLYRGLINSHDFDLLERHVIAPDAVFVFSDRREEGIAAVRAGFERTWSILPDEVYEMTDPEWLIDGPDAAACAFRYSYRGTLADGRPLSGGGQGINLFRRAEGRWRLTFEQLTPDTRTAKA